MARPKKILVIPDVHIPYPHKAYRKMLEVSKDISALYILGDYADFYSISSYAKHPKISQFLKTEINAVNKELDYIDKLFPKIPKVFIQGNHEHRLEKYINRSAVELFGMVKCDELFKIHERPNWRWIPYGPEQKVKICNGLYARHEPLSGAGPKTTAKKALSSIIYGHIHRAEEGHIVGIDNKVHSSICAGWLGNVHGPGKNVFDFVKSHHQWQIGWTYIYVDKGTFHHQSILVKKNNTFLLDGKIHKI